MYGRASAGFLTADGFITAMTAVTISGHSITEWLKTACGRFFIGYSDVACGATTADKAIPIMMT